MTIHLFPSREFATSWREGVSSQQQVQCHFLYDFSRNNSSLEEELFWLSCAQAFPGFSSPPVWLHSSIQQLFRTAAYGHVSPQEWHLLSSHPSLSHRTKNIFQQLLPWYQKWPHRTFSPTPQLPITEQAFIGHGWNAWSPQASWTPYGYLRDLQDLALALQKTIYLPIIETKFLTSSSEPLVQPWLPLLHHFNEGVFEELRLPWEEPPTLHYTPPLTNQQECDVLLRGIEYAFDQGAQRIVVIAQTPQRRQRLLQALSLQGIAATSTSFHFPTPVDSLSTHPGLRFLLETYSAERPLAHLATQFEELPDIDLLRSGMQEMISPFTHANALQRLATWIQKVLASETPSPFSTSLSDWMNTTIASENMHAWKQLHLLLESAATHSHPPLSRGAFVTLLHQAFSRICKFPPIEARKKHVIVTSLDAYCSYGSSCDVLFFTGFSDAEYPLSYGSESLGISMEVTKLHRILGRPVWPSTPSSSIQASWLMQALYQTQEAYFLRTSYDSRGRASLPCRYESWILPLAKPMDWPSVSSKASLPLVLSEIIAIEKARRKTHTQGSLYLPAWTSPVEIVERSEHQGILALKTEAVTSLGSTHQPLSVSNIEDYAQCPFRFFARVLLQANPPLLFQEEATAAQYGIIAHHTLRLFFEKRLAADQLPLQGTFEEQRSLEECFQQVIEQMRMEWTDEQWLIIQTRLSGLWKDLLQLIQKEAFVAHNNPLRPHSFEYAFRISLGPKDNPIFLQGIMDRIDVSEEEALVLDYKLGNLTGHETNLRKQLNKTSFQLPLYAFALRRDPSFSHLSSIQARYYSIRQQHLSKQAIADTEVDLSAVETIVHRIRMGQFNAQPTTCDFCNLQALCRIPST